jgi:hypothetical protein
MHKSGITLEIFEFSTATNVFIAGVLDINLLKPNGNFTYHQV